MGRKSVFKRAMPSLIWYNFFLLSSNYFFLYLQKERKNGTTPFSSKFFPMYYDWTWFKPRLLWRIYIGLLNYKIAFLFLFLLFEILRKKKTENGEWRNFQKIVLNSRGSNPNPFLIRCGFDQGENLNLSHIINFEFLILFFPISDKK